MLSPNDQIESLEIEKKDIFHGLNNEQANAVATTQGAVMVLAGAGAGKTKTLIHRTGNLILSDVPPTSIMLVTFTNKAAEEIKHRLSAFVGESAKHIAAGTFHSICFRKIMQRHATPEFLKSIGLNQGEYVILDDTDSKKIIKDTISSLTDDEKLRIEKNEWKTRDFEKIMSLERAKGIDVEEFEGNIIPKSMYEELYRMTAQIWRAYRQKCREASGMDFDDILMLTLRLLTENPSISQQLAMEFKYVMLDEYQDTNPVQMKIMDSIIMNHGNVCVVGDEKQSIYRFRGSDIRVILDFQKRYPDAKIINLNTNYRSSAAVLDAANSCANAMEEKITDSRLVAGKSIDAMKPEVRSFATDLDEARWLTYHIARKLRNTRESIAILYRNRALKGLVEKSLLDTGIPYHIVGDTTFFSKKEVKDCIAMLRFMFHPWDSMAGLRLLDAMKIGVSAKRVQEAMNDNGSNVYQFLSQLSQKKGKTGEKIRHLLATMSVIREAVEERDDPDEIKGYISDFWHFYLYNGLEKYSKGGSGNDDKAMCDRTSNVSYIFDRVKRNLSNNSTIDELIEDLTMLAEDPHNLEAQHDQKRVQLMTIHASKGLEFHNVHILGMEDGICPNTDDDDDESIEEERRVFYVAMTRAIMNLSISNADARVLYGQREIMKPSRFLTELGGSINRIKPKKAVNQKSNELNNTDLTVVDDSKPAEKSSVQSNIDRIASSLEI